jgi:Neisseria meningitidis TspB protein
MRNYRWLYFVFGLILGITIPSILHAQAQPTIGGGLVPVGSYGGNPYPGGLNASSDFRQFPAGGPSANDPIYRRPYPIPNGSLGRLGRGLIRGGAADLAMMAALAGLGWALDSILQDIYKPAGPYIPSQQGVWILPKATFGPQFSGRYVANTPQEICPMISQNNPPWTVRPNSIPMRCQNGLGNSTVPVFFATYAAPNPNLDQFPQPQKLPVSDDELGKMIRDDPRTWPGALNNPEGKPYLTPELLQQQESLRQQLQDQYGLQLNPTVNPSPNPNGAPQTNPNVVPNSPSNPSTQTQPMQLQFPLFCTWAPKVCELADWFREDPEAEADVDTPEVSLPLDVPVFTSSIGGGSCPAPIGVTVLGAPIEFSYQPMCTLAGYLRYVIIACSLLGAAYIISGKKRA